MPKTGSSKKKKAIILAIIIIVALTVYLNRAYAHIYGTLGSAGLKPAEGGEAYIIDMPNNYNIEPGLRADGIKATTSLVYVALGDSLTAGVGTDNYQESFPYLLAEKFAGDNQRVTLKNRSIPGETTTGLIDNFLPAAINDQPDVVTLLIGVNDIHDKATVLDFRKNYEEILSRLQQETKAKIYIINLPFIGAESLMLPPYQFLFDARTKEFNEIIKELAVKHSIQYIDLYSPTVALFKHSGNHYSPDLFHPSAIGYNLWAEIIYDSINQ